MTGPIRVGARAAGADVVVDVIVDVAVIDRRDRGRARDSGTITVGVADAIVGLVDSVNDGHDGFPEHHDFLDLGM